MHRRRLQIGIALAAAALLAIGALRQLEPRRDKAMQGKRPHSVLPCQACHAEIFRSYSRVGMARSFRSLAAAEPEPLPATVHHSRSGRYYEALRRGNRLVQRRYELDR